MKTLAQRFWEKVDKNGPIPKHQPELGRCWTWFGSLNREGYGHCYVHPRRNVSSHRVSWQIANGPIPDGLKVCHHCDYPSCVNPAHLFLGTDKDNAQDKARKGRSNSPSGERHGSYTHPERRPRGNRHGSRTKPERVARGERCKQAKLTADMVKRIRESYANGGVSQRALGREFMVSQSAIHNVLRARSWMHVQ
jgi:ribosome-binding protein aMBF1 (putative translation factor)